VYKIASWIVIVVFRWKTQSENEVKDVARAGILMALYSESFHEREACEKPDHCTRACVHRHAYTLWFLV